MEPVTKTFVWAGAAVLVVINGVTLMQVFGVPITADQGDAVVKFFESALALAFIAGGAWFARSKVTPVEKVEDVIIPATAEAAASPTVAGDRAVMAGVEAGQRALVS